MFECVVTTYYDLTTKSCERITNEVVCTAESFKTELAFCGDLIIGADCDRTVRAVGTRSSLSKFIRDLEYNVTNPISDHLKNCEKIRNLIQIRNRKLFESKQDNNTAKDEFNKIDSRVFEWLFILEEYRGDILDSLLQTIKYLEYEFFASFAHTVASVLPQRMEFRPLVEMTPKQLETQLAVEQDASSENAQTRQDYSKRIVEKSTNSSVCVDFLSLSSLLAQGFQENEARKALKATNNDTQAALDLLVNTPNNVRLPTTLARLQRLRELRKKLALRKTTDGEQVRDACATPLVDLQGATSVTPLVDITDACSLPPMEDLLFG